MRQGRLMGAAALGCLGATLAACGSTSTSSTGTPASSQCQPGSGVTAVAATAKYRMVIDAGPVEQMYTPAQVAAQHLTKGEEMLGGHMVMPSTGMEAPGQMGMAGATNAQGSSISSTPMMTSSTMGSSTAGSATPVPASSYRHLEVHICDRSTGMAVQGVHPAIRITDHTSSNMTTNIPIAVMQGIGSGTADLHYGNNAIMPPGHSFTVTVTVGSQMAAAQLRIPS